MYNKEQILGALSKVIYPGGKDIVSMNMVEKLELGKDGIIITLKTIRPKDPLLNSLKQACVQVLKKEFGDDTVVQEIKVNTPPTPAPAKKNISNPLSKVKNIIAIASGKGGVGKSTVSVNLATTLAKEGYSVGLLDADIFGPSAPKMFGAETFKPQTRTQDGKDLIIPMEKYGVKVLSAGFFVNPNEAIVWRGPMASGFLKQMIDQGDWGELDYLLIDLPPGTSDIHLTLVQEVGVTGVIIVSTPQQVAIADAIKSISMFTAEKINVPVLGLIENMAWFTPKELPNNKYYIFGKNGCVNLSQEKNIPLLGQIPLEQGLCDSGDSGLPLALGDSQTAIEFKKLAQALISKTALRNKKISPTKKVIIK